jgi:hypothetical protein
MTTATREPDILEREVEPTLPLTAGGTVNVQVSTARQFPRSVTTFIRRATEMATLTPEIAASCVYALPRDGKTIEGPSARLAEIVASAWGNLRIQAGATENDDRYVTARGEAWDVETNVAIGFEVRRRITNKRGETYSDDMIVVTGNAAASIALRNAVFKAVPSPFWRPIYLKCRQVIAGDAKTFAARRDDMLKAFMVAGVTHERLCGGIGLKGIQDITLDHMATLVGILNTIKEGEITIEEAFPEPGRGPVQSAQRKSQQQQNGGGQEPAGPERAATGATDASHAEPAPAHASAPDLVSTVGKIKSVETKPTSKNPYFVVTLFTGFVCSTWSDSLATDARSHQEADHLVELLTEQKNPKFPPTLKAIAIVEDAREPGAEG